MITPPPVSVGPKKREIGNQTRLTQSHQGELSDVIFFEPVMKSQRRRLPIGLVFDFDPVEPQHQLQQVGFGDA